MLAILAATVGPASARSGPPSGVEADVEGLTVIGEGTVSAAPDLAEIDLNVSASAEITGDAIVKFRDAKKRILEAFEALKLPNVSIEERGLLVDQKGAMNNPYYIDYGVAQKARSEVQLSRKLVVKATGLRAMEEDAALQLVGRLLDVAQDAGAHVGPPQPNNPYYGVVYSRSGGGAELVRFVLVDAGELRELAYEKAVADARRKAERLARLNGVELGPVVAVREVTSTAATNRVIIDGIDISGGGDDDEPETQRLASSKLGKIPVRVDLQVRFEIHPAAPAQ